MQIEMWRDALEEDDLIESIVNAKRIHKTLRSHDPVTDRPESLYVIKGRTFAGQVIYTKGTIRKDDLGEIFYIFISGKRST